MANKWIISNYEYREYVSLKSAEKECQRLQEKFPKKKFKIYRIKDDVVPNKLSSDTKATAWDRLKKLRVSEYLKHQFPTLNNAEINRFIKTIIKLAEAESQESEGGNG